MVPRCINCKYYLIPKIASKVDTSIYAKAKCMKFLSFDIKFNMDLYKHYSSDRIDIIRTNPDIYESAYICRSEKDMCGPKGSRFVPINNN